MFIAVLIIFIYFNFNLISTLWRVWTASFLFLQSTFLLKGGGGALRSIVIQLHGHLTVFAKQNYVTISTCTVQNAFTKPEVKEQQRPQGRDSV